MIVIHPSQLLAQCQNPPRNIEGLRDPYRQVQAFWEIIYEQCPMPVALLQPSQVRRIFDHNLSRGLNTVTGSYVHGNLQPTPLETIDLCAHPPGVALVLAMGPGIDQQFGPLRFQTRPKTRPSLPWRVCYLDRT